MNRAQVAARNRAEKLIALYLDPENSMEDICREMGWQTTWPKQMVTKEIARLRKRGYEFPNVGSRKKPKR